MTFLEKLKKEYPNEKHPISIKGHAMKCPGEYGFENTTDCPGSVLTCIECWNREMPEEIVDKFNAVGNPNPIAPEDARKVICPGPHILDSGNRREFESGAVRDIQEGKGRCDLMPLDVVAEYMQNAVIGHIANFQQDGDIDELYEALCSFVVNYKTRWSDCDMLLEVSEHFEEGAKKYGENNWQKGIPVHCYINSAVRHYLKYMRGDKDEPHNRAFVWNLMCAVWTCKHKPELNEYARVPDPEADVSKRPYDPVAEAYKILVSARDGKANYDLDELIGYLGEALDE